MKKASFIRHCLATPLAVVLVLAAPQLTAAAPGTGPSTDKTAAQSPLTSILLVAQDAVSDPNFGGSIVVVMNNLGPAPEGIIVNRPMPLTVARFFPKLKRVAQVHDRVYFGGPVEFGTVWFLFRAKTAPAGATRVCDGLYVSWDGKLLRHLLARRNPMEGLRIFVGHAGWAPGQLQAEIEGGAWVPRRARADAIFNAKPQLPWPSRRGPKAGT